MNQTNISHHKMDHTTSLEYTRAGIYGKCVMYSTMLSARRQRVKNSAGHYYVTFLFMRGKNMYLLNRTNLNAIPTRLLCIMLSVLTAHKVAKSEQI